MTAAQQHPLPRQPELRPYRVTTSIGSITVMANTCAEAISAGLELRGGNFLSCLQEGDW